MEVGKREIIYLSLHCHHQNDSCVKMGSDESQFNVSVIVRGRVTRLCPQTTTIEEKGEPKWIRTRSSAYQPNALPVGQTGLFKPESVSLLAFQSDAYKLSYPAPFHRREL